MKKYVTKQNIAALARRVVLGAFTLLVAGFSPAIAATLSRSVDVGVTLSAMWSMIGPLFAIRD
jgi:large-conductance mechanosensitive channel